MRFVVLADDEQWEILRNAAPAAEWLRVFSEEDLSDQRDADAFFYLNDAVFNTKKFNGYVPVFISSMVNTLAEINAAENIIRLNCWPGFLEKDLWETAGKLAEKSLAILRFLGKRNITVNDEPGFVSARIISMIINEAYFATGENVSSEKDIDTAMKLGTNYPYGPFEWAKKIGLKNVYALLKKLAENDERYVPAPAMDAGLNFCS